MLTKRKRPTKAEVSFALSTIPRRKEQQQNTQQNTPTKQQQEEVPTVVQSQSDLLPFDQFGNAMTSDSLLAAAIADVNASSDYEPATMPLSEVENQWLLLTGIKGPFDVPSDYGDNGRSRVLSITVLRNLDASLNGTVERLTIGQTVLFNTLNSVAVRTAIDNELEIGIRFRQTKTKDGKRSLWLVQACDSAALRDNVTDTIAPR